MALREHNMPKIHVRGGKLTVIIPKEIRDEIDAYDGEKIDIRTEDGRIVLTPKDEPVERHPDIDAALAEALAEVRAGHLSPKFASMEEFKAWLKTPEGKKFGTI
jgi:AbrB family looped-hinge helix DNA binding protein